MPIEIETVTIFRTWVEIAASLKSDAERGKLYHAVCEYSLYGKEPQLTGILNTFFTLMRPSIDKSNKRKIAQQKGLQMRLQNSSQNTAQNAPDLIPQNDLQSDITRAHKTGTDIEKTITNVIAKETSVSFVDQLPEHLQTETFRKKWKEWEKYRRSTRRKAISQEAFSRQLKDLQTWTEEVATAAIEYSISSDYQRLVAPNKPAQRPFGPSARKDYSGV